MNDRTAARKFFWMMVANFTPSDLVVTLTYSNEALPATANLAKDHFLKPAIRKFRAGFLLAGAKLKYMYVTEGLHGDKRLHHHIILPKVPGIEEIVRSNWTAGYVKFESISERGYDVWAGYLTKEPRKTGRTRPGQRMWTPSLHLKKPTVTTYEVSDDFHLEPPLGAIVKDRVDRQNEWFLGQYLFYYKPEYLREN